jgi:hypothetical protein
MNQPVNPGRAPRVLLFGYSGAGLAGFAVFWDGQAQRVVEEGGIGAAISLMLLVSAVAFPGVFS